MQKTAVLPGKVFLRVGNREGKSIREKRIASPAFLLKSGIAMTVIT